MKQVFILFSAFIIAGFLITGCNENHSDIESDHKRDTAGLDLTAVKKIITEKNIRFTQAHITGDTTFLNNIFTADARIFPPNSEIVTGRSAIAALNTEYVQYGIKEFSEETIDLYGCEDFLVDAGNYYMVYGADNIVEKGKYLNVWKRVDGDWKLYQNMWNSSQAASAEQ